MFYFFLSLIIRFLSILYQSVPFLKPSQYYHINVNSSIIIWYSSRLMRCFFSLSQLLLCFFPLFATNVIYCYGNNSSAQVVFCILGDSFVFVLLYFFYYVYAWCHIFTNTFLCDLLFHFGSRNTLFFQNICEWWWCSKN